MKFCLLVISSACLYALYPGSECLGAEIPGHPSLSSKHVVSLKFGTPASRYLENEHSLGNLRNEFIAAAARKNPDLVILDKTQLDLLKKDKIVIGFAGPSSSDFDYAAYYSAVENLLAGLNSDQAILATGATDVGLPKLVYDIGKRKGFTTIGITSQRASKYEPALMDGLYWEGYRFGDESRTFTANIDALVNIGGGPQTYREGLLARQNSVPVYNIANETITGASSQLPGEKFNNGQAAAKAINADIADMPFEKWKQAAQQKFNFISIDAIKDVYKGKKLIGFTGWSVNPPEGRLDITREFISDLLNGLNPKEDIIVTGGTNMGAEKIVHEEARKRGFKIIGVISQNIVKATEPIFAGLNTVVVVSRSWETMSGPFVDMVDALVSLGGRKTTNSMIDTATSRGMPTLQMQGNITNSDLLLKTSSAPPVFTTNGTAAAKYLKKTLSGPK